MIVPHCHCDIRPCASPPHLSVWQLEWIDYGTETKKWLSVVKFSRSNLGHAGTWATIHILKSTKPHILTANSILKGISCPLWLHSQRSEEPGAHGPQWPVRPLRQAQTDPRSQEWEQAEDQDHQMLPQSCLEWKLHLVRLSYPAATDLLT